MTLKLQDLNLTLTRSFPHFGLPLLSGYFCLDENRQYSVDFSNLKYYFSKLHESQIKINLNLGIDNFIKKSDDCELEGLDKMLQFILDNYPELRNVHNDQKALYDDIVCFRGLMTVMMCTPYLREDWTICIIKWKKTMYLCAVDKGDRNNYSDAEKYIYWGRKFEQCVLTDVPNKPPDTSVPINESLEFCCMFRTRLDTHRILYGAEMDAVDSTEVIGSLNELRQVKFVEVKTTRHITTNNQELNFHRFKLLKYWCQSFLVGINTIMVGKRDDFGMVTKIDKLTVSEIPCICKGLWSPSVCANFFSDFLHFATRFIGEVDSPYEVFEFNYNHRSGSVTAQRLANAAHRRFLPMWYIDGLTRLSTAANAEAPEAAE